ncbi:MAG: hypothetical protein VX038_00660 [Verrucomicrobiota bacterium]|nr:hypothetical protein [Verrucomicrobiota bacterium]
MKLVPSFLLVLFLIPDVDCLRGDSSSSFATPHRRHGQIFKSNHYNQTVISNNSIMQPEIDLEETNISDDTFRVNKGEFDQFFTLKFGLLYQKLSSEPFSGRIILIDEGSAQKYVYSDECWLDGRKDGTSMKWFSNGTKMYERNYKDGKWHGTVTRWWPNGQKMYVTAYSEGVKAKKEAKWMSDGTQLSSDISFDKTTEDSTDLKSSEPSPIEVVKEVDVQDDSIQQEATDEDILTSPAQPMLDSIPPLLTTGNENIEKTIPGQSEELVLPTLEESGEVLVDSDDMTQDSTNDLESNLKLSEETAVQDQVTLPGLSDESMDLPTLSDSPETNEGDNLPPLPDFSSPETNDGDNLPPLPDFSSPETNDGDNLPPLPDFSSPEKSDTAPSLPLQDAALSDLPELPNPELNAAPDGLPPLPNSEVEAPSNDLPELPNPELNAAPDGLPPLPNPEGDVLSDDLPPLPPLP